MRDERNEIALADRDVADRVVGPPPGEIASTSRELLERVRGDLDRMRQESQFADPEPGE